MNSIWSQPPLCDTPKGQSDLGGWIPSYGGAGLPTGRGAVRLGGPRPWQLIGNFIGHFSVKHYFRQKISYGEMVFGVTPRENSSDRPNLRKNFLDRSWSWGPVIFAVSKVALRQPYEPDTADIDKGSEVGDNISITPRHQCRTPIRSKPPHRLHVHEAYLHVLNLPTQPTVDCRAVYVSLQ